MAADVTIRPGQVSVRTDLVPIAVAPGTLYVNVINYSATTLYVRLVKMSNGKSMRSFEVIPNGKLVNIPVSDLASDGYRLYLESVLKNSYGYGKLSVLKQ